MSVTIQNVIPNSICDQKGIRPKDVLISINGNPIQDILDYQFYLTETVLKVVFRRQEHTYFAYKLYKQQYEEIGLEFETYLMDKQHSCTNQCIFCFVDQMPPNMRKSLYFKDDDARLSFLFGNYITLTNLKQQEIDRIIKMKISPINISVHTTNPQLRCQMMKNRFAGETLDYIRQLTQAGITVNCQLVLCPGINDGTELQKTLQDLGALYPGVQSIACVPVGLTKFRQGLYPLERYQKETAQAVIETINHFTDTFFQIHQTRLAYASDEFYLRAEMPLPQADFYEDFAQLENGVGVIALLKENFWECYHSLPQDDFTRSISIATGTDAAPFIQELIDCASKKWHNLHGIVYPIRNDYFGESITVAGLVTATDLIKQLKGKDLGDVLILPNCMLRHEQDKFLDDYTVKDVEQALNIRIKMIQPEGDALLHGILEEAR